MKRSNALPTSIPNTQLYHSIVDLLNATCKAEPVGLFCIQCRSSMLEVDTTFTLLDREHEWHIPLPVCPQCDVKVRSTPVQTMLVQ